MSKASNSELLAVILIIAAVGALVCPLVAGMENPYTAKCAANGKQVVNALLLYMAEYDGRFPSEPSQAQIDETLARVGTWHYDWYGYRTKTWNPGMAINRYLLLRKYVRDDSVWVCPNPRSLYSERYAYGYRCNWLPRANDNFIDGDAGFRGPDDDLVPAVGRTVEEVEAEDLSPSRACGPRAMPPHKKIIAMCYALGEWGNSIGDPYGKFPFLFPSYTHEEGSNFAYVDGHVSWSKMGRGWAPIGYTKLEIDKPPTGKYSVALSSKFRDWKKTQSGTPGGAK